MKIKPYYTCSFSCENQKTFCQVKVIPCYVIDERETHADLSAVINSDFTVCIFRCWFVDVPRNTSVSVHPSGDIEESDSVTLTCSSDANPPVHNFTWYTNKLGSESAWIGQEQSYNILNISTEHTGSYYCKAENKRGASRSSGTFLDVYCEYWYILVD